MNLNYKKIGEGGKPLFILHGVFGSLDNWGTLGKIISEAGYTVYLVDQRNHGRSPHSADHNYQLMAEDLKELIDTVGAKDSILIGHSMGGKTVMQFAVNWPDLLSKLIVVDIGPKAYPIHHKRRINGMKSINLQTLKSRNEADELLKPYERSLGIRQFLLKNLYRDGDAGFKWRFNLDTLEKDMPLVGEPLQYSNQFEKETLFIKGELSDYILDEDWKLISEIFLKAKLVTIKDADHWVQADQPQIFVEEVLKFLGNSN